MAKPNWDATNIPDQKGRVVIITGATSGLGKEAARVLAGKKASVIMAVRNGNKGEGVADEIRKEFPNADLTVRELDLTSLSSVKNFSESDCCSSGLDKNGSAASFRYSQSSKRFCPSSLRISVRSWLTSRHPR